MGKLLARMVMQTTGFLFVLARAVGEERVLAAELPGLCAISCQGAVAACTRHLVTGGRVHSEVTARVSGSCVETRVG